MHTEKKLWLGAPALRYNVIYDFDQNTLSQSHINYLIDIVTPELPEGAKVNLKVFTDMMGDANNKKRSLARANDVRVVIEKALANAQRTDVTLVSLVLGENDHLAPFKNNYPEKRLFNRSVIIEVIPVME